jgi:hypothetical protein
MNWMRILESGSWRRIINSPESCTKLAISDHRELGELRFCCAMLSDGVVG